MNGVLVTMTRGHAGVQAKDVLLVVVLTIALGACADTGKKATETKVEVNVYPTDYKSNVLEMVRQQVADPTEIRDAYIAAPILRRRQSGDRYIACLRYNAKDPDGNYVGSKEYAAFFYAGQLTQIVDAGAELCVNAPYQPFPEMQKLCREIVCKS